MSYLQQVFLIPSSSPDEQHNIKSCNNNLRDIQRWVGQEVSVTEHESEVDSIGLNDKAAAERRQMVTVAVRLHRRRLWSNLQCMQRESHVTTLSIYCSAIASYYVS